MQILFTIVHVLVSVVLILVVLLQTGKRADLAGAFGGGGSQTAFGARGTATVLSKATTVCAVTFMVTSLGLAILTNRNMGTGGQGSVLDELPEGAPVSAPAPSQQVPLPPVEQDATQPQPQPSGDAGASQPPSSPVDDPGSSPPAGGNTP